MKLPEWLRLRLYGWAITYRVRRRDPDWIIGGKENPYMLRWWVIPRNPLFNVYLHEFHRDDDDRALHDHPWANCSIILNGGYFEVRDVRGGWPEWHPPGTVLARMPWAAHRIVLNKGFDGLPKHAVTLFITGPRIRAWGFWCPQGWVHWRAFTDPSTAGATVGKGCEQ